MAAIYYTANARATLIGGHSAGTAYSFDVKLREYLPAVDAPKTQHVTLGGAVETVLRSYLTNAVAVLIWPNSNDANMNEFLGSVAGGETWQIDPYGSVAVPDSLITYITMGQGFEPARMSHGETPWRSVTLNMRAS